MEGPGQGLDLDVLAWGRAEQGQDLDVLALGRVCLDLVQATLEQVWVRAGLVEDQAIQAVAQADQAVVLAIQVVVLAEWAE